MRSWMRIAAVLCAVLMVLVVFHSANARAHPPGVPGADFNYALASNGGVASSSGYYKTNAPSKAIDGNSATYWQSASKTGWLSVRIPSAEGINEVHVHMLSKVFPALSLYYDLNGDGDFSDAGERVWSTTSNGVLDVVISASAGATLGIQVTIDASVGNNKPMVSEFEAYQVPPDSDGDGLTDDQELGTFYYQEATLDDGAVSIPDDGENATSISVAVVPLSGILQAAFTNMTIEHLTPAELTVQLGYWNGTGWVDRYLWDPGSHAVLPAFTLSPSGSVGGIASVEAAITNGVALSKMEFHVDGVLRAQLPGDSGGLYEWSWDTRDLGDGTHVLSAVAYDQPGNQVAVSNSVTVDNTGPAVSIAEPTSGSTVLGFVETRTLASDPAGVAEIRFYVDGAYAGSTATPQPDGYYHWTWDARFSVGDRDLKAEAVDTLGNIASHTVAVTVVADTEGPGISILSPLDGSTVKGLVQVKVAAYDPSHIGYVLFYINETLRGNVSAPQADGYYYWTWDARAVNGSRVIRAEAVDTLGNSASQEVGVVADNNLPPEVYIALPVDGAVVSGTSIKVVASASDPDGTVVSVEFFRDGLLQYTDSASPWDWTFDTTTVADGFHTLTAEALDNWLSRGFSEPVSVCVNNRGHGCREPGPMGMASVGSSVILGAGPASVVQTGLWSQGSNHTLEIDLRKGALDLSASERDAGILGPSFGADQFHTYTAWRLVIRDWSPGNSGTLVSFLLRTEVTSDPANPDTDGDGIPDGTEVRVWGTLPVARDSDVDGLTDDYEITPHSLILTIDGVPTTLPPFTTNPAVRDTDGEGLSDGEERSLGVDRAVTNPLSTDTDHDGLWDGYTIGGHPGELSYGANATRTDTDGDTFSDWLEVTPRDLTLTVNGTNEVWSVTTLPYTNDSDADGLTDNQEWYGTSPYGVVTNPSAADTDGDGLFDGQELFTATVKTPNRYPFPAGGSTYTEPIALKLGVPESAITQAVAMVGITAPDMGTIGTSLAIYQGGVLQRAVTLKPGGANAGEANNFTSYDLLQLGVSPAELARPAESFALWVFNSGGEPGQAEYFQIQVTALTLPNRADTDGDGLNDSEEVTLGHDGYVTNPWMVDTDLDGVADGLESNGWAWSGSTIVSNSNGFKTDPTRADTDRDGVADGQDRVPTGDAFIDVLVYTITPTGTGASDGDTSLQPFASITIGGQTSYTDWRSVSPGSMAYIVEDSVVNVDDESPTVSISIRVWDYDTRVENGHHDDVHTSMAVATDTSYGGCSGVSTWTFPYTLAQPGGGFSLFTSSGSCPGATYLRADPIEVHVSTVVPQRALAYLVTPGDYSGVYNLTDSGGNVVSRRYTGEAQFVGIVLNVTSVDRFGTHHDPYVYLVPRSVFFDSLLSQDLSSGNLVGPLGSLSFAQNATTAARNSDALQEMIFGNVTAAGRDTILGLLQQNATGAVAHGLVYVTPVFYDDPLFLYSFPDDVLRLDAYEPTYSYAAATYRFCATPNCEALPTTLSIWDQIWLGLIVTVTDWVVSAVVFAATAFQVFLDVLAQLGAWFAQAVSTAAAAVASAVQAAAKAFGQLLDSFFALFTAPVRAVLAYLDGWRDGIVHAALALDRAARSFDGSPASVLGMGAAIGELLAAVFRPDVVLLLTVMSFAIMAAVTATIATGIGYLIVSQVVPMIVSLIVSVVVQAVAPAISGALEWLADLVDSFEWKFVGVLIAGFDVAVSFMARYGGPVTPIQVERNLNPNVPDAFTTSYGQTITNVKTAKALILAIAGLALAVVTIALPLSATVAFFFDVLSLGLGMVAMAEALSDPARVLYGKLTAVVSVIEIGISAFSLSGHLASAARGD